MKEQSRRERLAAEARKRFLRARKERERYRDESSTVGNVLRIAETADLGVLWALVERDVTSERFLAVAADLNPLIATADVATPADSGSGALSLRCAVELWLDDEDLDGAIRIGSLDRDIVEQVRQKRSAPASGDVDGPLFARETDDDPEYRDWLEDGPERARAVLLRKQQVRRRESSAPVPGFRRPEAVGILGIPYSLAASVLLVMSLTLSAALVWQQLRPGRIGPDSTEPEINVPFVHLVEGRVRSGSAELRFPDDAKSGLLLVETSESYPCYRLEIHEEESGNLVWATDKLQPTAQRATRADPILLTVRVPRSLLVAGHYRVALFGLAEKPVHLDEFLMQSSY